MTKILPKLEALFGKNDKTHLIEGFLSELNDKSLNYSLQSSDLMNIKKFSAT
jgi:hypothetical protein